MGIGSLRFPNLAIIPSRGQWAKQPRLCGYLTETCLALLGVAVRAKYSAKGYFPSERMG